MTALSELPRNDVDAAIRYIEERLDAEEDVPRDDLDVLVMLQDDSSALKEAFTAMVARRRGRGLALPSFLE